MGFEELIVVYFSRFDLFANGVLSFISLFAFLYVFTYFGIRTLEHPHEKTIELLLAPIIFSFFLSVLQINKFITGVIVILVYVIFSKQVLKWDLHETIVQTIKLFALLGIFAVVDEFSRWILFFALLAYNFIVTEKEILAKNKKEKGGK